MKKLLFLIPCLSSLSLMAMDDLKTSNLIFMPLNSQVHYKGAFTYLTGNFETDEVSATRDHTKWDTSSMISKNYMGIGFLDNLEFGVDINYLIASGSKISSYSDNTQVYTAANYNSGEIEQTGLQDPRFQVRLGVFKNTPFTLVTHAGFSVGSSDREVGNHVNPLTGSAVNNGNAKRGGHALDLGAEFGSNNALVEWKLFANVTSNLKQTHQLLGKDTVANRDLEKEVDAHNIYQVGFDIQKPIHEKWNFTAGGDFTFMPKLEGSSTTLANVKKSYETEAHTDIALRAGLKVDIIENLTLSTLFNYNMIGDYSVKESSVDEVKVSEQTDMGVTVGLTVAI